MACRPGILLSVTECEYWCLWKLLMGLLCIEVNEIDRCRVSVGTTRHQWFFLAPWTDEKYWKRLLRSRGFQVVKGVLDYWYWESENVAVNATGDSLVR